MKINSGILLDTGPLVSLLNQNDPYHKKTKEVLKQLSSPFRTCEAVLSEACFILKRMGQRSQESVLELGKRGFYQVEFNLQEHLTEMKNLIEKYQNIPISLADACLIRMAEVFEEPRIFTFDSDFEIYRWGKNRKFKKI